MECYVVIVYEESTVGEACLKKEQGAGNLDLSGSAWRFNGLCLLYSCVVVYELCDTIITGDEFLQGQFVTQ
jgi:hypothetical protein